MSEQFDASRPIYAQLVERLKARILAGTYPPGGHLDSVRDLAAAAGVNPNTMQRALQELESRLMSQGASLSDYLQMAGMTEEDLRSHARENALESARYELAMTEIARLEHIQVTDEDVERRYQEMSRQFGVPVDHIRQQLPPMQLSHDLKLAYARAVVVDNAVRL